MSAMSRAEQVILAALDRGPLYYETHVGCGWYFPTPYPSHRFGERVRRRYFRTMDVRRLIARGLATQVSSRLVKAQEKEATVTAGRRVEVLICDEWIPATESGVEEPDYFVFDLDRPARNGQTSVCVRAPVPEWRVRALRD